MEIIHVSGYVGEEKLAIADRYLIPQAQAGSGVPGDQLEVTNEAIETLIKMYCRESGVRNLQKHIEKVGHVILTGKLSCDDHTIPVVLLI